MIDLPTPAALASIVDEVSQAMYGVSIRYAGECAVSMPVCNATAATIVLPLIGDPLYLISAHADSKGGAALASAIFNCESHEANYDMVEDSLRELCNMVAGQVTTLIAQQHEIGMPSRLTDSDMLKDVQQWSGATLHIGPSDAAVTIAVATLPGLG
jgi:CheY-specific phosphatase CheX